MTSNVINKSSISLEVKEFLKLSVPLACAQIAQAAVGFVDTIMMGHLSIESLAAGGLAATTFQLILNTFSGLVMAVSPLVAEAHGARQTQKISHIAHQGLWLSIFLAVPLMILVGNLESFLSLFQQPLDIISLANPYLKWILWGIFPALGFAMLRGYVSALAHAHIVTPIVIIGTIFNITGNYVLGFGKFSFPRMELAGFGLASGLSFWLMFAIFLAYTLKQADLKKYNFLNDFVHISPSLILRLIRIGSGISVTLALEYGLFAIITFFMGLLGAQVLAAHHIVYQTMLLLFMIPLGMSYAVTARVGQWVGKKDFRSARLAGYVAIVAVSLLMLSTAVILMIFPEQIISIFIDVNNPENLSTILIALPMLYIVALSQLFDGVQRVTMGALYGLQDTQVPMLLSGLSFWVVGLSGSYVLGFTLQLGSIGLWIGQTIGVVFASILFTWRFTRLTQLIIASSDERSSGPDALVI